MNWPRLVGVLFALGVHAALVYALGVRSHPDMLGLAEGNGSERLNVVATVSLENGDLFSQEARQAAVDATAAKAEVPEKPKNDPPKKQEMQTESPDKPAEPDVLKEDVKAPEPPLQQKQVTQAASVAATQLEEQRAAAELAARRNKLWPVYVSELHSALERHKIKPRNARTGEVLLRITIAPTGSLVSHMVIKSSGSPELDSAAVTSLVQSAPFPPIPPEIASGPLTLTVPFQFLTR